MGAESSHLAMAKPPTSSPDGDDYGASEQNTTSAMMDSHVNMVHGAGIEHVHTGGDVDHTH